MKTLIVVFISLLVVPVVAEETPSEFMQRWVKSFNANSGEVMASYYDESEHTECIISAGIMHRGFKKICEMYEVDMKAVRFYDSKAEEMRHSSLGEETALVSFIHKFKYEIREQKKHLRIHIRTTVTLRRIGKDWKIVSEHSSPIHGIERVEEIDAPVIPIKELDDLGENDLKELSEVKPGGLKR